APLFPYTTLFRSGRAHGNVTHTGRAPGAHRRGARRDRGADHGVRGAARGRRAARRTGLGAQGPRAGLRGGRRGQRAVRHLAGRRPGGRVRDMASTTRGRAIREEMYFNLTPLRRRDRIYGGWDFLAVQICFGIAAWFFLTGSLTGLTVPAREALPIILFGNSVPLLLVAALAVMFARYGVEHWLGSAAVFGHRFKDVWLLVYITSSFGWIAYASFLFGQSATRFLAVFNGPDILT